MPKLDISVDKELYETWKKYIDEHEEIKESGLVRKLIREYLIKKGIIKKKG